MNTTTAASAKKETVDAGISKNDCPVCRRLLNLWLTGEWTCPRCGGPEMEIRASLPKRNGDIAVKLRTFSEPSHHCQIGVLQTKFSSVMMLLQKTQARPPMTRPGRVICVSPGFDAATLRSLLAILEEASPC